MHLACRSLRVVATAILFAATLAVTLAPSLSHAASSSFSNTNPDNLDIPLVGPTGADDAVAPDTTITVTPPNPQTYSDNFEFTGSDNLTPADQLTFLCSLDAGEAFTCTSPYEVMDLLPGFHLFQVSAVDAAGNIDPTPAEFTWEVRPLCGFDMATIYIDWTGIVRGGPQNGQPYTLTLNGTTGNDIIFGSPYDDMIYAFEGTDIICSGSGNDTIYGGAGNDTVYAFDGDDVVYGGDGNDTLNGGPNADKLYGEGGNDTLNGSLGNDELHGGNGSDTLISGPKMLPAGATDKDLLYGENGNDTMTGGAEADTFDGGAGTDTIADFNATQGDTKTNVP